MLNDHEDNLFYRGWGMANEPVYNQQATAYLLRDEVKPAIRSFYSEMACAFQSFRVRASGASLGVGTVLRPTQYRRCLVRTL